MRTATMIVTAVAAGVVGAGAVVTPLVLAATDDQSPSEAGPRWAADDDEVGRGRFHRDEMRSQGPGRGQGMGPGAERGEAMGPGAERGQGMGPGKRGGGDCGLADLPSGTLTDEQKESLAYQAELEKLSHDVYTDFAKAHGDYRFERIAESEVRHLEALQTLMDRYDVKDPTEGLAPGEFSDDAVAKDYEEYVEAGSTGLAAALETAQQIETRDIEGLTDAVEGLDAPDAEQVYEHLTAASEMHLEAFSR